jgi:hypothetical protein
MLGDIVHSHIAAVKHMSRAQWFFISLPMLRESSQLLREEAMRSMSNRAATAGEVYVS